MLVIVGFALIIGFRSWVILKTKYHPTAWIGKLIAKLTPLAKNNSGKKELLGGSTELFVLLYLLYSMLLLVFLEIGINLIDN